jgi:hypothetical protein
MWASGWSTQGSCHDLSWINGLHAFTRPASIYLIQVYVRGP